MSFIRSFVNHLKQELVERSDLWPLAAALGLAGSMSILATYHATKYNDVMFDRWKSPPIHDRISWDKPREKLFNPGNSREMYKDDVEFKNLLKEIYADDNYK